jgi:MFS family permease
MPSLATSPGARRLLSVSIVARLPLATLCIVLLIHAQRLTESFATAGLVTAAYAVALGIGGPLLGRIVDRRGQTAVLCASAAVSAAALGALALLPAGVTPTLLIVLATGLGLATPPVGACVRALLPDLVGDRGALRALFAVEASAVELTWVFGPPLALAAAAVWSTGAALIGAAVLLLAATLTFAVQPASRTWRPAGAQRPAGGSLGAPAMRTLVLVMTAIGVLLGAVEVAVTAAADSVGGPGAAAPLLGLWGVGSLAGGLLAARRRAAGASSSLPWLLAALTVGHGALIVAATSLVWVAAVLLLAGAAIAPTYALLYAMVDEASPANTATEAFAWLATAAAIGAALGSAAAGAAAQHAGPSAAFALAAAAGAGAWLMATVRAHSLVSTQGFTAAHPAAA